MHTPRDHPPSAADYRADIDGLRGLAILSVIFYHVGLERFSGGFIGVDVFFVISGFLITRQIRFDIESGLFTFALFYQRRLRRLFPAMLFTWLITLVGTYIFFSPEHMEAFGGALLHAMLAASNIYFWQEQGYFSPGAIFKPLLHTWSLSVEEQFYLVWPGLLLVLSRGRSHRFPMLFLVAAGGLSLFFAQKQMAVDPEGAYYLTQYRVVEFACGAILVWLLDYAPRSRWLLEGSVWVGLAMIIYPLFTYTTGTPFPGVNALLPCLGTFLLIYGGTAPVSGKILNNPPMVGLGLISYSLYLIHWPIIVFYNYYHEVAFTLKDQVGLLILSVGMAWGMYRYVETPFRLKHRSSTPRWSAPAFALACALSVLVLIAPTANIWKNDGWPWRFSDYAMMSKEESMHYKKAYTGDHVEGGFASDKPNVIVFGDSQAQEIFQALRWDNKFHLAYHFFNNKCGFFKTAPTYRSVHCERDLQNLLASPELPRADILIFSQFVITSTPEEFRTAFGMLRAKNPNLRIYIFGFKPTLSGAFLGINAILIHRPVYADINTYLAGRKILRTEDNQRLRKIAEENNAEFVHVAEIFCMGGCVFYRDGKLLMWDSYHWTHEGEKHFLRNFQQTEHYRKMVSTLPTSVASREPTTAEQLRSP